MTESMLKSTNPKDALGIQKVPLSLIPLSSQIPTALAHLEGALKYNPWNWREKGIAASVYIDATLRHILKWYHGEQLDSDSGIHHLGHAAACLNILMDAQFHDSLIDDRPPAGEGPAMLDGYRYEVKRLLILHDQLKPDPVPRPEYCDEPGILDPQLEESLTKWADGPTPSQEYRSLVPTQYEDEYGSRFILGGVELRGVQDE